MPQHYGRMSDKFIAQGAPPKEAAAKAAKIRQSRKSGKMLQRERQLMAGKKKGAC